MNEQNTTTIVTFILVALSKLPVINLYNGYIYVLVKVMVGDDDPKAIKSSPLWVDMLLINETDNALTMGGGGGGVKVFKVSILHFKNIFLKWLHNISRI